MTCAICGLDATDEPFEGPRDGVCPYAWNDNPAECYRIGYEREHALAEEAKKIALKLSVEVSEQKARADAAEADAKHSRLVLAACSREEKAHRDALAAARREIEGLRAALTTIRDELNKPWLMGSEVNRVAVDCANAVLEAEAALAAPAAGAEGER